MNNSHSTKHFSMKKLFYYALFLLFSPVAQAQFIKIDNGVLFSSFRNELKLDILTQRNTSYATALGIDYLQKKHFYLSSQIGYLQIGGHEKNDALAGTGFGEACEQTSFVHLNTQFRYLIFTEKPFSPSFFVSLGPFANILSGKKAFKSYYQGYDFQNLYGGLKTELGITKDFRRLRLGLVGSYLYNLSPTAKSSALGLNSPSYSIMFTLGYRI